MLYLIKKAIVRIHDELLWWYICLMTRLYYDSKGAEGQVYPVPHGDFCDLAVVAFNNAKVIEYQIRCLNRFFVFPFRYTVYDNSTNDRIAVQIMEVCKKHDVGYIRLPKQDFLPNGYVSYSHGIACNYIYHRYIKNGGGKYFGMLDHDIFPIEPFDPSVTLDKQFFMGVKHRFYIWPGLCFLRMDYIKDKKVDFRPSLHLRGDTGACNAKSIFKNMDWNKFDLVKDEKRCFNGKDDIFNGGYSYFDAGWIHAWNASNYLKKESMDDKMRQIYQMLEEKLS